MECWNAPIIFTSHKFPKFPNAWLSQTNFACSRCLTTFLPILINTQIQKLMWLSLWQMIVNSDGLALFRKKHCGFVFQQIYLIDTMSVLDNVLAAGLLVNKDKKALTARAKELFSAVDIPEETMHKFPTQISGGEAQRAGIVRALINSPEILFADEPTGALNSKSGLDVLDTLTAFNNQGQSVVMVTHDMRSARRGNRILYLKDGSILGECELGAYQTNDEKRHKKLADFLAEMGW